MNFKKRQIWIGVASVTLTCGVLVPAVYAWSPGSRKAAGHALEGYSALTETSLTLHVSTFITPAGKIHVNTPGDASLGDSLSGTVTAEPAGNTEEERKQNEDQLNGYVLDIAKHQTPVAEKVLKWAVPAGAGIAVAALTLHSKDGQEVGHTEIPLLTTPPNVDRPPNPTAEAFRFPTVGQAGRPMQIGGPFDGDLTSTNVQMNGKAVPALAESPRMTVVQCPADKTGATKIEVTKNGVTAQGETHVVSIQLSADKLNLQRGERTTYHVMIHGLAGIKENDVTLELVSHNPEIVAMSGGNIRTLPISPSDVKEDGVWTTQGTLTGVQPGAFNMVAYLHGLPLLHVKDFSDPKHRENVTWPPAHVPDVSWPPHTKSVTWPTTPHLEKITWPSTHIKDVTWPPSGAHTPHVKDHTWSSEDHYKQHTWPHHIKDVTWPPSHVAGYTWASHVKGQTWPPYHNANRSWPSHKAKVTWPPQ